MLRVSPFPFSSEKRTIFILGGKDANEEASRGRAAGPTEVCSRGVDHDGGGCFTRWLYDVPQQARSVFVGLLEADIPLLTLTIIDDDRGFTVVVATLKEYFFPRLSS